MYHWLKSVHSGNAFHFSLQCYATCHVYMEVKDLLNFRCKGLALIRQEAYFLVFDCDKWGKSITCWQTQLKCSGTYNWPEPSMFLVQGTWQQGFLGIISGTGDDWLRQSVRKGSYGPQPPDQLQWRDGDWGDGALVPQAQTIMVLNLELVRVCVWTYSVY